MPQVLSNKPADKLTNAAQVVLDARSTVWLKWFTWYVKRLLRKNFHGIRIYQGGKVTQVKSGCPLIVYTNHPSWWDPLIMGFLGQHCFPQHHAFGAMDQLGLDQYPFMRKLGIFGVELNSQQGARYFLKVAKGLLQQPNTALWLTAQGRFADVREQPPELRPGLAHILRQYPQIECYPLALEYTFWDERCPEVLASFGPALTAQADRNIASIQARLTAALATTQQQLATAAITRDPSQFKNILTGEHGVAGIYRWVQRWRGQ